MKKSHRKIRLNSIRGHVTNYKEYKLDVQINPLIRLVSHLEAQKVGRDHLIYERKYQRMFNKANRKTKEGLLGMLKEKLRKFKGLEKT